MANKRLNDLPEETDPAVDDVLVVDGATTRKATRANLLGDNLEALRGLTSAADKGIQFTGSGTAAVYDLTTAGKALLDDANAAAQRTTLGLVIGTDVQAYDGKLADITGITYAQGDILYHNGTNLVKLAAGTSGYFLKTLGAGNNPSWAEIPGGGDLFSSNNLSDVADVPTSRVNLGFPSMSSGDYRSTLTVNSAGTAFQIMKRTMLLPDDFGWTAGGSLASRHAAMVAWAADSGPGTLDRNTDYEIDLATGSLLVAAGKIIEGNGALIYDTTNHGKLMTLVPGSLNADTGMLAGRWQIGNLRLQGALVATYSGSAFGIWVEGTDNSGSTAEPTYVENFLLDNIEFEDIAGYGVWERFTDGGLRQNLKMQDIGYIGFAALSCRGLRVVDSRVVDLGPGTSSNAYGFTFTRGTSFNTTVYPRCSDCVLDRWLVKNNTIYTGADTHSGEGIKILNGRSENVYRGINVGYDADGANAHGALNCVVKNNTCVASSTSQVGILHTGYPTATDGYSVGCVIEGNHIEGYGDASSLTLGGVYVLGTKNVRINNNSILQCKSVGISFDGNNYQAIARDNYVEDTYGDTLAAGIGVSSSNNEITFGPNSFRKTGTVFGVSNIPYGYNVGNSSTHTLKFEGGDQGSGLAATYNIGATVTLIRRPRRVSVTGAMTIAAGAAFGTVALTLPEAFASTPLVVGVGGLTFGDANEIICGVSSVTTTTITLIARTVDGSSIGASGVSFTISASVEGW